MISLTTTLYGATAAPRRTRAVSFALTMSESEPTITKIVSGPDPVAEKLNSYAAESPAGMDPGSIDPRTSDSSAVPSPSRSIRPREPRIGGVGGSP